MLFASTCLAQVFPGATWEFRTPAEFGINDSKLNQFVSSIGGTGCIVYNGYMIKTWGNQGSKADWASAVKPVISTMLFFAIQENKLPSVDDLIYNHGWALVPKDQTMTFRHLANMIGNYTRTEAPGAAWAYNDYGIQLYQKTLFDRVYGTTPNAAATAPTRLGALQFQDGSIFSSRDGYGLYTSVRDYARIGWFWLNKGNWNGTQLLPTSYFDNFMKPYVPGSLPRSCSSCSTSDYLGIGTSGGGSNDFAYGPGIYGFNWWFNAKGGLHPNDLTWPDAPLDTFQANGHWNTEIVTVIPSRKLVVSAIGNWGTFQPGSASAGMNQNLKLLAEAVPANLPNIHLNTSAINRVADYTENLSSDSFVVTNSGSGTLQYSISDNVSWLNVNPPSGSRGAGQSNTHTINYTVNGLAVGTYNATITVSDNGSSPPAPNSPQTIDVSVRVKSVLPDLDLDGDVDQEDFGLFQACYGNSVLPGCEMADFNDDGVISQTDFGIFLGCFSGTGVLADKTCDDVYE